MEKSQPVLSIGLRPLEPRDIETAANWGLDSVLCRAAEWNPGQTLEYHRQRWTRIIISPSQDLIRLGVVTADDRIVGYTDLYGSDPSRRELGFVIGDRSLWGMGFGRTAASLTIEYGLNDLNLATIDAQAWDANQRSVRILRRLGMRETGFGDSGHYLGSRTFYRQFEISASEWPKTPPKTEPHDHGGSDQQSRRVIDCQVINKIRSV